MINKEEVFQHPSYGMIGFHRVTGSTRLFGSSIPKHNRFITLSIKHGERMHHQSRDWYFGKKQIIEVNLSAAQFADLITSMNMGDGVPCTINWLNGTVEPPPDLETETEKVRTNFREDLQDLVVKLKASQKEVEAILEQKSIKVADRKTIKAKLFKVVQDVEANLPFVLESFQEASTKVVTHAKAEIESFTTTRIMAAGVEHIRQLTEPTAKEGPLAFDEARIQGEDE